MDKSNDTTIPSSYTKNENFDNVKQFVKELKVCTLDPARYLQRCIAVASKSSGSHVAPNSPKCLANTGTLRNICISKNSFISEKPDDSMITNIITARASGNYYDTRIRPSFQPLTPRVYTSTGSNYLTNPTGVDNKPVTIENPKKLLLQMLKSAVIAAKKKHAAHLRSKKRHKKKKKHRKNSHPVSYKSNYFSKTKKAKISGKKSKHSSKRTPSNAINQKNPSKNNIMINKMLEETEEMLRITFLSNIQCFSGAPTTPITASDLLEKSDMSQLLSNFISKMVYCAKNLDVDESRQCANTLISTTVTKKSKEPVKKAITGSQPHVSVTCKRKASSTVSVGIHALSRVNSLQGKSKNRQKINRLPIGFGRPGKDDTEEAELAHCIVQPDPPSAISAPYREPNPSPNSVAKSPVPQESQTSIKSDVEEEKPSYRSSHFQRFRDPILDHRNQTKLLPLEYNSQITYVCPSTEFNLKGNEEESATANGDRLVIDLSAESQKSLEASDTSLKTPVSDKKLKTNQTIQRKTKANISRAVGRMVSKTIVDAKPLQQRKVPDTTNRFSNAVVPAKKYPALRSNNKQIFKKTSERKLHTNNTKRDATPRASSSFTSGGLTPISIGSRYQRQQRQFTLPANDVRLHAVTHAERRFFNRNEHLLFLARPNIRHAEDTKQRYGQVLDQYHVRNLNTIIFCNQAEESRLKKKREQLLIEEFIEDAVKAGTSRRVFEESPKAPNVSEASSSVGTASEDSLGTDSDTALNLTEELCLEDILTEESRRKSTLSVIQEEPEDIEDVDKFYMSIAKSLDNYLNISSFLCDDKEVEFKETNAQGVEKTRARVIELDYRISDRFQAGVPSMDVEEITNEDEDNVLVLRNPEIASEEPHFPLQNTYFLSINPDFSLPIQLYKSMETVAPNLSTFITVFEGMQVTLRGMQETCHYRTICSKHYITQDEIKRDCTEALLRAKETNLFPEKYFHMNNNQHVMRCEVFFTNSTLPLGTKTLYNNFLYILYRNPGQRMLEIISNTAKKSKWDKLVRVNLANDTPNFIRKLDYSTVLQINPSKLLQKFTIEPNVLYFVRKSSTFIDNVLKDNVDDVVLDASMNITDCNPITDNAVTLPLLNAVETTENQDIFLSVENENTKSAMSTKQILTDTTNCKFGVEEGQTVFIVCSSAGSKELTFCTPRPSVPTINLQSSEVKVDDEDAEVSTYCQSTPSKELIDYAPRPLIPIVKFPAEDAGIELDDSQGTPPKKLIDHTAMPLIPSVKFPAVDADVELHDCENTPSKEPIDQAPRPLIPSVKFPEDDPEKELNEIGIELKYKNSNCLPELPCPEFGVAGQTEDFIDCQSIELTDYTPRSSNVKCHTDGAEISLHKTGKDTKCKDINCLPTLQTSECANTIKELTHSLKEDISNKNEKNINKDTKQDNSIAVKHTLHTTFDHMQLGDKIQENMAMEEISSDEGTLPQVANLQQEHAVSCFDEPQSNISAINENAANGTKKNELDIPDLKPTCLSNNVGSGLKKATKHHKSSKAKYSHFSYSHNTDDMWISSSGSTKTDLNIKDFSNKAANDTRNASCHELTTLDSSPYLNTETSILEEKTSKLKNGKESACSKQPTTPVHTLDSFSKLTQTDIAVEPKTILSVRQNIKVSNVSTDGPSSKRKNKFSKSIKIVFLGFISLCAASFLPTIPDIKPAVWSLINTYIMT